MSDTTTPTTSKPWYASKTMWVNILSALGALAGVFGFGEYLNAEVQASVIALIMAGVNVVNIILRKVTSSAIG